MAAAFADWGTADRGRAAPARSAAAPQLPVIASGGLRDGVDVAKCLALGAAAAGLARPFLLAAQADRAGAAVGTVLDQLRIATWAAGRGRGRRARRGAPAMRAVVVGAGLGGLGAALRLQGMGWDVTVVEQRDAPRRPRLPAARRRLHLGHRARR